MGVTDARAGDARAGDDRAALLQRIVVEVAANGRADRSLRDVALAVGPWLEQSAAVARRIGAQVDEDQLRAGVAVTRGLLIDVLATGGVATATRAMRRFVAAPT
jgi:hypothetical protein